MSSIVSQTSGGLPEIHVYQQRRIPKGRTHLFAQQLWPFWTPSTVKLDPLSLAPFAYKSNISCTFWLIGKKHASKNDSI